MTANRQKLGTILGKKNRGFKKCRIIENKKIIFIRIENDLAHNFKKESESVTCNL